MNECKDHGSDEAPWMCECTREKLAAMTAERDEARRQIDALCAYCVEYDMYHPGHAPGEGVTP